MTPQGPPKQKKYRMKLRKLQLEKFRSYESHSYDFSMEEQITILVGNNGLGKTNFLEAIYLLSLGRSFRTTTHDDLVQWEQDFMRLSGEVESDDDSRSMELFYSVKPTRRKNFKINDLTLKNSEYIGHLLTVLFHPEDLNMLYLSPSYRRKYLDILLSQTDREYLFSLSQYRKILKQRNSLLEEIRQSQFKRMDLATLKKDLDVWDEKLIEYGSKIIERRLGLVEFLENNLEKIYQKISGASEAVRLRYECNAIKEGLPIMETYPEKLSSKRDKDIICRKTSVGPHRDDLVFFINHIEVTKSASRGEFRTLLLAIKLAEIQYIREKTNENPVLLLDDVFSELDENRQNHLIEAIRGCQTIITTTDIKSVDKLAKENPSIRFVKIK